MKTSSSCCLVDTKSYNLSGLNFLPYEVPVHLHMLSPILLDLVVSNIDSSLIVTMDSCWPFRLQS